MKRVDRKYVSALHDANGKLALPEGVKEVHLRVERCPWLTNKDIGEEGEGADEKAPPAHWTIVYGAGVGEDGYGQSLDIEIRDANNAKAKDLRGAYLALLPLQGASLRGARLQGANLFGAQLQRANLREAQLEGAYLEGALLEKAYLVGAQLRGANLRGAGLQSTNLRLAQLQGVGMSWPWLAKKFT